MILLNAISWRSRCCVLLAVTLAAIVEAGAIYYPAKEGLTFYAGDAVNVTYASDYNKPQLWFCWQNSTSEDGYAYQEYDDLTAKNGSYVVYIDNDINADYCWFNVFQGAGDPGLNSATFTVSPKERGVGTTLGLTGEPKTAATQTRTEDRSAAKTSVTKTPSTESPKAKTETSSGTSSATGSPDKAPDSKSTSSSGLSSGAKAGIGVGVALGVIGLGALGVAFWMRRKRRSAPSDANQTGYSTVQKAEMDASPGMNPRTELDTTPYRPPVEMPS